MKQSEWKDCSSLQSVAEAEARGILKERYQIMSKELIDRLRREGDGVMSTREKRLLADTIERLEREIEARESWRDIIKERDELAAEVRRLKKPTETNYDDGSIDWRGENEV